MVDTTCRTRRYTEDDSPYYSIIHADDHKPSVSGQILMSETIKFYSCLTKILKKTEQWLCR